MHDYTNTRAHRHARMCIYVHSTPAQDYMQTCSPRIHHDISTTLVATGTACAHGYSMHSRPGKGVLKSLHTSHAMEAMTLLKGVSGAHVDNNVCIASLHERQLYCRSSPSLSFLHPAPLSPLPSLSLLIACYVTSGVHPLSHHSISHSVARGSRSLSFPPLPQPLSFLYYSLSRSLKFSSSSCDTLSCALHLGALPLHLEQR